MSTRIGKYIFDINLKDMSVEALTALKEGCDHYIKEQHREEIHKELTRINLLAHTYGFDITVAEYNCTPTVLNELTLSIDDREE